jgi:hypothetical protein
MGGLPMGKSIQEAGAVVVHEGEVCLNGKGYDERSK